MSNHLGNVLEVVTDPKLPVPDGNGNIDYFLADVVSYSDYYPFGMPMPGRNANSGDYRYGFNGMEKDDNVKGLGNSYTTEFRQYDLRVGRWLSLDPLMAEFPWQSPYVDFDNTPIYFVDIKGLEAETTIVGENDDGTYTVLDWIDDGKTDIITQSGEKIGNSLTTHSFVSDNGCAVEGAQINLNDNSGQIFFNDEINRGKIDLWHYMKNATGGEDYDFKRDGTEPGDANYNNPLYHYRGMSFEGKIASARDIGNYAAGATAGANGLAWKGQARLGFDLLQKWQDKSFFY